MVNKWKNLMRHIWIILYFFLFVNIVVPIAFWRARRKGALSYLSQKDSAAWKKGMQHMLRVHCLRGESPGRREVANSFIHARIEIVRKSSLMLPEKDNPIVVLCVKNDLRRIEMLVAHYRELGIERFAFLDNGSTDGTLEWCLEQEDIDLYRCTEPYRTLVKEGWINRIVSCYGFNRWYILTDSDELLVYKGMEIHPITDLVRYAEKHHLWRVRGLTLDTYMDGKVFSKTEDIQRDFRWIDSDSYRAADLMDGRMRIPSMIGGPRWRLMGSDASQSKFPLVYFTPGVVSDTAHYQFPLDGINESTHQVGILHYKFLNVDQEEYRSRMEPKRGFRCDPYRKYFDYLDSHVGASFMYEGSVEFTDSGVLDQVHGLEPIDLK